MVCMAQRLSGRADVHAEILDFGYPQNSEIDTLKMYITTESIKSELAVVSFHTMIIFMAYS